MSLENTIKTLKDASGADITNMNASWTSKAYSLGDNLHLGIHLFWDDPTITGVIYLDYSCDPIDDKEDVVQDWLENNAINLDGTFSNLMFLDSNLAVSSFRVRYTRVGGSAGLNSYIVRKRR